MLRRAPVGSLIMSHRRCANGGNRRSAEARDPTDRLPLAVRERTFARRVADGKVCPKPDRCSGRGPRSIVSFHLRRMAKGVSTGVWLGEQRNRKLTI